MLIPNATKGCLNTHYDTGIWLGVEPKVECADGFYLLRNNPFFISQRNIELKINTTPSLSNETNSRSDEKQENSSISQNNLTTTMQSNKVINSSCPKFLIYLLILLNK